VGRFVGYSEANWVDLDHNEDVGSNDVGYLSQDMGVNVDYSVHNYVQERAGGYTKKGGRGIVIVVGLVEWAIGNQVVALMAPVGGEMDWIDVGPLWF
jgi:hypothetical protein